MENDLQRIREEAQKKLAAMQEECDLQALQQQLFGKTGNDGLLLFQDFLTRQNVHLQREYFAP